jgi:hypothetical protein
MWDLERAFDVTDKVDILLTQQQAQSVQLSQLLSQAGGYGAKIDLLAEKLTGVAQEMSNVRRHISECPARAGFETVKTRLEYIERQNEKVSRKTPRNGLLAIPEFKGSAGTMRMIAYIAAAVAAALAAMFGIKA